MLKKPASATARGARSARHARKARPEVRSSENLELRTSNPLVSPVPRVSPGYPARCSLVVLDVRAIEFPPCSNSFSADY